jgi:hypothetical protein
LRKRATSVERQQTVGVEQFASARESGQHVSQVRSARTACQQKLRSVVREDLRRDASEVLSVLGDAVELHFIP